MTSSTIDRPVDRRRNVANASRRASPFWKASGREEEEGESGTLSTPRGNFVGAVAFFSSGFYLCTPRYAPGHAGRSSSWTAGEQSLPVSSRTHRAGTIACL